MQQAVEVYISNMSEDIWEFIACLPSKERKIEVPENAFLSDRDVFALHPGHRSILIVPQALDPDFVAYYQTLFAHDQFEVWVPRNHSGQICRDLLADKTLWRKMLTLSQKNTIRIKSYSASAPFYEVVGALRAAGGNIETPESPPLENSWTVNFFGSKSGIRQLTNELSDPDECKWMSKGYISQGIENTAMLAANMYQRNGGVVIKTNKAHSGAGIVILRQDELGAVGRDYTTCLEYFRQLFSAYKYWREYPIVIEDRVEIDGRVGGGNPNCEFCILPDGTVQLLYYCGMRVSKTGVFKGIEIQEGILPAKVLKRLLRYGRELGEAYAKAGYRGYYDVDCVLTTAGELLMTESNIRRTGGTHVYAALTQLLGSNFMKESFVLSHNSYQLPTERAWKGGRVERLRRAAGAQSWTFAQVHNILASLLFDRARGEGVILAAANPLRRAQLSYIIVGKNRQNAVKIEKEMERLLLAECRPTKDHVVENRRSH